MRGVNYNDLIMDNDGVLREVKPKFPVGTLVKVKRTKLSTVYNDDGETNGPGVYNDSAMLRYQEYTYRVIDVKRRIRDVNSYWVYILEGSIYYYAESMLVPIERKEVFL